MAHKYPLGDKEPGQTIKGPEYSTHPGPDIQPEREAWATLT
ncbi:MAG TPA: hypothetical protein VF723_17185 [Pyrinomonadaceae bacterium]